MRENFEARELSYYLLEIPRQAQVRDCTCLLWEVGADKHVGEWL